MPSKRPVIPAVPTFYERIRDIHVCSLCDEHRWVIIHKVGLHHAMHTTIKKEIFSLQTLKALHIWRYRQDDPTCLNGFASLFPVPNIKPPKAAFDDDVDEGIPIDPSHLLGIEFVSFAMEGVSELNDEFVVEDW